MIMVKLYLMKKRIENGLCNINSFVALREMLLYYLEEAKRFALKNARRGKGDKIWFCELNNMQRAKIIKKAHKEFKASEKENDILPNKSD